MQQRADSQTYAKNGKGESEQGKPPACMEEGATRNWQGCYDIIDGIESRPFQVFPLQECVDSARLLRSAREKPDVCAETNVPFFPKLPIVRPLPRRCSVRFS